MAVKREQVVQTAEKYVARGKIEPAIREYRKLLEENPNDINTLNRVGDLYARIQRIDEAVDFFNQIAEQYAGEGFFVKAIAIYKKIIKLDPTRLDVYENLAELYHRQGLVTEARTQYQVLADYYQKHENATSTIAIYQKMADLEPNNPTYHVKLAELYHGQKLIEKAMGEYRIIAELMIEHGHPQEAAQVYERALAIDASNIGFITDAALKLKEAAGAATAARFLAAAVERNPQAGQVARLLGAPPPTTGTLSGVHPVVAPAPPAPAASARPAAGAPPAAHSATSPPPPQRSRQAAAPVPPVPDIAAPDDEPEGYYPVAGPRFGSAADGRTRVEEEEASGLGASGIDLDLEIELDLAGDLEDLGRPAAHQLGAIAPDSVAAGEADVYSFTGSGLDAAFEIEDETAAGAAAAADSGSSLLGAMDEDDVFVLDIEDEEEPASLVKPPPDMLVEVRRPSWAQEGTPSGVTAAPGTSPSAAGRPLPGPPAMPPRSSRSPASPPSPPLSGASVLESLAAAAGSRPLGEEEALDDLPPLPELPRLTGEFAFINPFSLMTEGGGAGAPDGPPLEPPVPTPQSGMAAPPATPPTPEITATPAASAAGAFSEGAADAGEPILHIDSELLERTAAEIQPQIIERYEDLVSEAEVLAKYGLEEKAIERLREAIRIKPRQLSAYFLLIQLQLDKGRFTRVMELANQVAELTAESADRDTWPKLRRRLLAAGFRVDGERVIAIPDTTPQAPAARRPRTPTAHVPLMSMPPAPRPAADAGEQLLSPIDVDASGAFVEAPHAEPAEHAAAAPETLDLDGSPASPTPPQTSPPPGALGALGASGAATAPTTPTVSTAPRRPAPPPGAGIDQMLEGLVERPSRGKRRPAAPAPSPAAAPELPSAPESLLPAPESSLPEMAAPAPSIPLPAVQAEDGYYELPPLVEAGAEPPPSLVATAPPVIFNPLEIGAMVESEDIDWDEEEEGGDLPAAAVTGSAAPKGSGAWPAHGLPPAVTPAALGTGPAAASASLSSSGGTADSSLLDDTGMSWLDEADSGKSANAARAASLFDEEEDFFDLAGELEQELSQEAAFQGGDLLVQQEQSLEEIVEGFKKGVAEHLSPTDYDTHYNLGIAYREMGLLDEAIGEFQLSAKDPRYLVSCCSMLGLCFLDKGLPELAIKWYRRGLEAENVSEEDHLGLLYDMGCAYIAMGDKSTAYRTFVDVYGINTNYRDVVARIEELGHPH